MRRALTPVLLAAAALSACLPLDHATSPIVSTLCVSDAMAAARVPGVSYAILQDGAVAEVGGLGVARQGTGTPVTPDTVFEAASLSKPVFAYLVLRASQDGMLELDEPIAPASDNPRIADKESYAALTPRLILSQRSGLPNWARNWGTGQLHPLVFEEAPGERFRYSGEAYLLLQDFLERRSGVGLDGLLSRYLGDVMPSSAYSGAPGESRVVAHGHDEAGQPQRSLRISEEPLAPASLYTTARDYGAFLAHLLNSGALSHRSRALLFTGITSIRGDEWGETLTPEDAAAIRWGLGFGIFHSNDRKIIFHWGDNGEFRSFFALDAEQGDGFVFFANGLGGLKLVRSFAERSVGRLTPIGDWLGFGPVFPVPASCLG